jgi:hypothetical protein
MNKESKPPAFVDIDEGENWMVTRRKQALKAKGWTGTIQDWDEAFELLGKIPLSLRPPIKSLEAAKKCAKK